MSNRAAVFGGAGFIGTNLVYQLISKGVRVFNFDNLSGLGNLLNIAELMQQSQHSFARCDVTNSEETMQALLMAAADTLYFCITPKKPEDPEALLPLRSFLDSVLQWRKGMKDETLHKIVVVISEHHQQLGRYKGMYDNIVKLLDEYSVKGLPVTSLVVPPSFGPFQQPDSPVALIIYRALEGETIPLLNSEEESEELVYVGDIVKAINLVEEKGAVGSHYELEGTKPSMTNFEIADTVCDTLNEALPPPVGRYQALIEEVSAPQSSTDLPKHQAPLDALGLPSKTPLREALKETVRWYLENTKWYSQSRTRFFYLWRDPKVTLQTK